MMNGVIPPISTPCDEARIRDALRRVVDPEAGMNIVDLGLVYRVAVDVDAAQVLVEMTMTSPACPMGDMIVEDVEAVLGEILPPPLAGKVRLVWEPPWDPSRMSDAAREHFGWEEGA